MFKEEFSTGEELKEQPQKRELWWLVWEALVRRSDLLKEEAERLKNIQGANVDTVLRDVIMITQAILFVKQFYPDVRTFKQKNLDDLRRVFGDIVVPYLQGINEE